MSLEARGFHKVSTLHLATEVVVAERLVRSRCTSLRDFRLPFRSPMSQPIKRFVRLYLANFPGYCTYLQILPLPSYKTTDRYVHYKKKTLQKLSINGEKTKSENPGKNHSASCWIFWSWKGNVRDLSKFRENYVEDILFKNPVINSEICSCNMQKLHFQEIESYKTMFETVRFH